MNANHKKTKSIMRKEPLAYFLCWTGRNDDSIAQSPKEIKWNYLPQNQYLNTQTWIPVKFNLPKPSFEDYLANDMGFQLFSERFRDLIEKNRQPKDRFQWLDNPITCGNKECSYFVLHFYDIDDVLDEGRVIWHPVDSTSILKPVFSAKKIHGHSIFTYLNPGHHHNSDKAYVSKELKNAILCAKMTGATFEATAVFDDMPCLYPSDVQN